MDQTVDPIDAVEVPEESEEQTEEQPRAEDGTFAEKQVEQSPEEPAEASSETTEVPEAPESWGYAADGQRYDVGTVLDGVVSIPADQAPHIQQLLAEGRHHQGNWQKDRAESQRQVESAQAEAKASDEVRQSLMDKIEGWANLPEDELADVMAGLRTAWPQIKAEAEAKGFESKNQAQTDRLAQLEREDVERRLEPQVNSSLEDHMSRIKASDPRLKSLSDSELWDIHGRIMGNWKNILRTPEGDPWNGQGEAKLDLGVVQGEMEYVATLRGRQVQQETTTAAAEKGNAAELGGTKAPPAVKSKTGTTSESSPTKRFKPSGKEGSDPTQEVDEYFESLEV